MAERQKGNCTTGKPYHPVIEDDYVDIEFGTGCLKVTPAHDVNDYMLGRKNITCPALISSMITEH